MLDQPHRLGRHSHGPDRLLVTGVPDVEHGVALGAAHLELVMDLGHQGADGIDDHAAVGPGRPDHLGRRPVGAEHQGRARRDLAHVVDEDHPLLAEGIHHNPVVHDLVVAVDGRVEDPDHPGQGLDGLLHAGTEPSGRGQQHTVDLGHLFNANGLRRAGWPPPSESRSTTAWSG